MTRTTPLRDHHEARGARFTDFGGWEMPVQFDSIKTEHHSVRDGAGVFDVSHMSEVVVTGPDATALMDRLTTNAVATLDVGDSHYSCVLWDDGVILDDTVVYRLPDDGGHPRYLFVPNAGNDADMTERWRTERDDLDLEATVENRTEEFAMFALQGPDAVALLTAAADPSVADISRFSGRYVDVAGVECWVARTGYTGEDGYELLVPWDDAERVWSSIDCQPCGLGARDTLRIEAGLLLAGQDFHPTDEPRTPYEAGIAFVVDMEKGPFVGREALRSQATDGPAERLVGIELDERAVPRHGCPVCRDGTAIGHVTSGTLSPTLGVPIAFGYVPADAAETGTALSVSIRDRDVPGEVVNRRFLERRDD